jgi:threonine aldolase
MMAAAALAALNNSIPQLPRVHALVKSTATKLESLDYTFSLPIQTNMITIDVDATGIPPAAFVSYCKAAGLNVFAGRLVFHYQTTQDAADRLVGALGRLMADKKAGKDLGSDPISTGCS